MEQGTGKKPQDAQKGQKMWTHFIALLVRLVVSSCLGLRKEFGVNRRVKTKEDRFRCELDTEPVVDAFANLAGEAQNGFCGSAALVDKSKGVLGRSPGRSNRTAF